MKVLETMPQTAIKEQSIRLIDGSFTASQAADIINDVLEVKINFHKLQRLARTEGNILDHCEFDNGRIEELIAEQIMAKEFLTQARLQGKKLKMKSTIHFSVEQE
ncbi:hypothetical protein [Spongiimicrobium salis]|uniref:hypothetical protein n=1 Tax=Spongiimicrobium salis TaxID=1667022 RepID=UPI00374D3EA5